MNGPLMQTSRGGSRAVPTRTSVTARLVVAIVLLGAACRSGVGAGSSSVSAPPGVAVTLAREACFGSCPVYSVELFEDGSVRFEGRAHVSDTGTFSARVPSDSVQSLVRTLRAAPTLASDGAWVEGTAACGRHLPDGPRFTLVLYAAGPVRTVQFDAGCTDAPRALSALADAVDRIAITRQWILGTQETQ